MAADTGTHVYDHPVAGASKIMRLQLPAPVHAGGELHDQVDDVEVLLGLAGDGAIAGVLRMLPAPLLAPQPYGTAQARADAIAHAITRVALEAGIQAEGRLDARILLGVEGAVWTICHMQAVAHPDGVAAIGSGEGPALGAADALLGRPDGGDSLFSTVLRAVDIGIARDLYSHGPAVVEVLEP